jgi:hypothetical protein
VRQKHALPHADALTAEQRADHDRRWQETPDALDDEALRDEARLLLGRFSALLLGLIDPP